MAKITILGSSGFIGKNLLNILPYDVEGFSLRQQKWREAISNTNVIINLIGKAHDHEGTASYEQYFYANVELLREVFSAFINSSAQILIHVSSLAAVEEFKSDSPLTEDHDCNPTTSYGKTKREAELWLLSQTIPPSKRLVILRPPMVHGPGDKGNLGLLYRFISKGIPYPLASFKNARSFISVENFSFFIDRLIQYRENISSGIYHIADDEEISTKQIIDLIKFVTGKNTPEMALPRFLVKAFAKVGDIIPIPLNSIRLKKMTSNLIVSNKKIKSALGIERLPTTAIEGLERTIRTFDQEASNSRQPI